MLAAQAAYSTVDFHVIRRQADLGFIARDDLSPRFSSSRRRLRERERQGDRGGCPRSCRY